MQEKILLSLGSIYDMLVSDLVKMEGGPEIQLKTLPTLSKKINGLARGRMYVIGGRTSQGKTTLAMQMAIDLSIQGFKTYFLSFEMDQKEMLLRLISCMINVDANEIRFNYSKYREKMEIVRKFLVKENRFPLLLTYNVGITMDDMNAMIEDLPQPDCVVVDYIQAIKKVDFDKLTTINNYIIDFRRLCVVNNFVGIMVSQINRAAMDSQEKMPHLWQLKGSGTLEEHADAVFLCHWDYFYTDKNKYDYKVIIAKNRQGATGYVDLIYNPECYKFRDSGEKTDWEQVKKVQEHFGALVKEDGKPFVA